MGETCPDGTADPRVRGASGGAAATARGPAGGEPQLHPLGYALPLWKDAFARLGLPSVTVLDPNPLMTDLVLREAGPCRRPPTDVSVEVVSKTEIPADVRASLGGLLRATSPATADALAHYTRVPDLFHVDADFG